MPDRIPLNPEDSQAHGLPLAEPWQVQDQFLELRSPWLTLIGEHLQDQQGQILEYWRVEKADSVIVLPLHKATILLPQPSYRPGLGQTTLDFPGGRVPHGGNPEQSGLASLQRELQIAPASVAQLRPLNRIGWAVNSSFSNQKLYGFVAQIDEMPNSQAMSLQPIQLAFNNCCRI